MGEWTEAAVALAAAAIVARGIWKGVDIYGAFCAGAEDGLRTAVRIAPALCAMTLMVGLARASGLTAVMEESLRPALEAVGIPAECTPLLLLRPLTGSGSLSALREIYARCGPDSRAGRIASILMGSSETIFYTMTVYLGAAEAKKLRYAVGVSLTAYALGALTAALLV